MASVAGPEGPPIKVDRQHTTPFLLKLFYRQGGFHRLDDFRSHTQPRDHIQIYTWRDCTLHELSILLSDALPSICPPRSRCGFRLIYADTRYGAARYTTKDLGAVVPAGNTDASLDLVARKTLSEVAFVIGDWIDVAVYPEGHGGVSTGRGFGRGGMGAGMGMGAGYGGGGGAGGRENGFGGGGGGGGRYGRGGGRGGGGAFGERVGVGVPAGEWRRGERVEDSFERERGERGRGRGGVGGGFGRRGGRMEEGRRYRD